jgi:hypothetical protein
LRNSTIALEVPVFFAAPTLISARPARKENQARGRFGASPGTFATL